MMKVPGSETTMKGIAARLAKKAGSKHARTDQDASSVSSKASRSTLSRSKSDMPAATSKRISENGRSCDELSTNTDHLTQQQVVFECSANLWPAGLALPESGKLCLNDDCLAFQGSSTALSFDYASMTVEKASRLGGLVHDAFKITTTKQHSNIDGNKGDGNRYATDEEYLFTTILKDRKLVFDRIQLAIHEAKSKPEPNHIEKKKGNKKKVRVKEPPLPADEIMKKMSVIGKEELKGVSVQDYYEVAWSEGQNSAKSPIYAPFLTSCGKNNVQVNPWEEGQFTGDWCQQLYSSQRHVTFNFMKQTIGQTLVEVKHTQRCIRNTDRCVVQISMEMKGFPYADCFIVEVRHVASRSGKRDLLIEVGMFVRFIKGTLFEGRIRSNTGDETRKAQLELLRRVCEGCKEFAVEEVESEEEFEEDEMEEQEEEDCPPVTSRNKEERANSSEEYNSILPPSSDSSTNVTRSTEIMTAESANSLVRTLLLFFASIFQKIVQLYISYNNKAIQPSSIEAAVKDVEQRIVVLKELNSMCGKEELREGVTSEILVIEESLSKIEKMVIQADDD